MSAGLWRRLTSAATNRRFFDGCYAIQRVYTSDSRLNEVIVARNNDVVLVPEGYHPVAAAHGYTTYYLNFLAGSAQSLANPNISSE